MQTRGVIKHTATQQSEALIRAHPEIDRIIVREVDCNCIRQE